MRRDNIPSGKQKKWTGKRCAVLCGAPVREFAPPCKASDTEAAEQFFEPLAHSYLTCKLSISKICFCLLCTCAGFGERTGQPPTEKEKAPLLWCRYLTLFGAYRECGILAGEQKALAISTKSAIKSNSTASAKQVRECGARVNCSDIISRSFCTSISALPQYLVRFATRYANPLRDTNFS